MFYSLQPHGLCSLLSSSVHRILQARILEWVSVPLSMGYSPPRDWTMVYCIAGRFFTIWTTREAPNHLWFIDKQCVSYFLLYKKLFPNGVLNNTHLRLHSLCGPGTGLWFSWVLCFRVSHWLQSRCWPGLQSFQGLTGEWSTSKLTHVIVGRIQFFMDCWLVGIRPGCWTEVTLNYLPYGLFMEQLITGQLA